MSRYALKRKEDFKLSEEVATDQVVELLGYYDIDVEKITDDAARAMFERALDATRDYIRRGVLEVTRDANERIQIVQTLTAAGSTPLTYGELGARHKLAMDKVKSGENYHRIYALMGSLCGVGSAGIEKLPARDLSVVEVLGTVFLNA
jgi:hypothetical protein